jgi:hypothetical protein
MRRLSFEDHRHGVKSDPAVCAFELVVSPLAIFREYDLSGIESASSIG